MIDDDTRERFLREIAAQVPADRIAELHLFRPLRRGATETGVAVIAVEQDDPAAASAAEPADEAAASSADAAARPEDVASLADVDAQVEAVATLGGDDPEPDDRFAMGAAGEHDSAPVDDSPYADDAAASSPGSEVELASSPVAHADVPDESAGDTQATADVEAERESPKRNLADVADVSVRDLADDDVTAVPADASAVDADIAAGDIDDSAIGGDAPLAPEEVAVACATAPGEAADVSLARQKPARLVRHTVFTARYRLTRKGADRGKWEFEVVADADAPLGTVDMVVRGVQRRAGDDEEPERLTAEGVRAALDGLAWQRTT